MPDLMTMQKLVSTGAGLQIFAIFSSLFGTCMHLQCQNEKKAKQIRSAMSSGVIKPAGPSLHELCRYKCKAEAAPHPWHAISASREQNAADYVIMSCTPSPKAAKPVWAKQLTRLPCLVVYVKFQFVGYVIAVDLQHHFVGYLYWPHLATVGKNRANHYLLDHALWAQRATKERIAGGKCSIYSVSERLRRTSS